MRAILLAKLWLLSWLDINLNNIVTIFVSSHSPISHHNPYFVQLPGRVPMIKLESQQCTATVTHINYQSLSLDPTWSRDCRPHHNYGNQDNGQISIPTGLLTSSTVLSCSVILRLQRMPVVQTCDLILFIFCVCQCR